MGRVVYAEERLLNYLKDLAKVNKSAVGLIIGQQTRSKDFVVHLARTAEEKSRLGDDSLDIKTYSFNSVKEMKDYLIADHARHVMRMLPGGFSVLGVFICTSNNIFGDPTSESTLKKILLCLKKSCSDEPYSLDYQKSEKLIFHYSTSDQKYLCKSLDTNHSIVSALEPVEWKFQNKATKWCEISCKFDLNRPCIAGQTSVELKTQFKNFLSDLRTLLTSAIIVFDGKIENSGVTLETIIKRRNEKNLKDTNDIEYLEASIFTPLKDSSDADIDVIDCDVELHLMGILRSQVFISEKVTIEEAMNAIKQDIGCSLAARLEMHWDSLVEEEYGSPEEKQTIHEPPRRVSVKIPNSPVHFTDYIFPGEGSDEVIFTFKELLDIEISEGDVNEDYEIHGDLADLCGKSTEPSFSPSNELLNNASPTAFMAAAISFAVILIGIVIALHFQRNSV